MSHHDNQGRTDLNLWRSFCWVLFSRIQEQLEISSSGFTSTILCCPSRFVLADEFQVTHDSLHLVVSRY